MTAIDGSIEEMVANLTGPGGIYPVVEQEIWGVTHTVFANQPASLREYFISATQHGDKPFVVYEEEQLTYTETIAKAGIVAHALRTKFDVKKGDRIVIAMRNYPEWVTSFMAITSLGCVAVPMNAWWTQEEFEYGLKDCGARVVIADDQRAERILPAKEKLNLDLVVARPGEGWPHLDKVMTFDALCEGIGVQGLPCVGIDPEDDATILYTSGSTGYPKGAVSTHRAVLSTLVNWAIVGAARQLAEGTYGQEPEYQPASLITIPFFHVTGCHSLFLLSMIVGRKMVLMYRWDAERALELIERERVTDFVGVPTMSWELMQSPNLDKYDLSSLQGLGSGGAARPPGHVKMIAEKMPKAPPSSGYGLTETNALGALIAGDNYLLKPDSAGMPTAPLIKMKITDEEGREVPIGERGDILIKSAANVRAYWNNPEATKEAFTDGWFNTGDIGYFDEDGYLFIVDRAKDIVIRGGENISCLEVEAVLYEHTSVFEAAVYGVPDERLGEEIAVTITPKPNIEIDPEELRAHVGAHLAKFKIPRYVWIQKEQLPRTATGKIFKRQLREEATKQLAS